MDAGQKNFEKELKAFDQPIDLERAERWYLWLKISFFAVIFFSASYFYLVFNPFRENLDLTATLGTIALASVWVCGVVYVFVLGFTASVLRKNVALWIVLALFFRQIGAIIAFLSMTGAINDLRRERAAADQPDSGDAAPEA